MAGTTRHSSSRSLYWSPRFPMAGALRSGWRRALPAYLAVMRAILPRPETWLIAAAFPAVVVNIGHGQNGFLTAALLGGALHLLDRRPWLAGVLIGCLAYKPQFGVLIPVALLAGGRWSTIAAAAATVAALVAVSFATLGGGVWHAFADFHELHADRGARTGRHRLGENSIDLLGGADVGRRRDALAYAAQIALATDARSMSGVAVAEQCRLRTQGFGAGERQPARDALRARLRSGGACGRDRISRAPWTPTRLRTIRSQPAGRGVAGAAAVARRRRSKRDTAWPRACCC